MTTIAWWEPCVPRYGLTFLFHTLIRAREQGRRVHVQAVEPNEEFDRWCRSLNVVEDDGSKDPLTLVYHGDRAPKDAPYWVAVLDDDQDLPEVLDFADGSRGWGLIVRVARDQPFEVPVHLYRVQTHQLPYSNAVCHARYSYISVWSAPALASSPGARALRTAIDRFLKGVDHQQELEEMFTRPTHEPAPAEQQDAAGAEAPTIDQARLVELEEAVANSAVDVLGRAERTIGALLDAGDGRSSLRSVEPIAGPMIDPWWGKRVEVIDDEDIADDALEVARRDAEVKVTALKALVDGMQLAPALAEAASALGRQRVSHWLDELTRCGLALRCERRRAVELAQALKPIPPTLKAAARRRGVSGASFEGFFRRPGDAWMITLARIVMAAGCADILDVFVGVARPMRLRAVKDAAPPKPRAVEDPAPSTSSEPDVARPVAADDEISALLAVVSGRVRDLATDQVSAAHSLGRRRIGSWLRGLIHAGRSLRCGLTTADEIAAALVEPTIDFAAVGQDTGIDPERLARFFRHPDGFRMITLARIAVARGRIDVLELARPAETVAASFDVREEVSDVGT